MSLPRLQERFRAVAPFLALLVVYAVLYLLNNRFQWREAWTVPRTPVDDAVALMPSAIYLYILAYPLPAVFYGWRVEHGDHRPFLRSFAALTLLSNLFFFLIPTTVPRLSPSWHAMGGAEQFLFSLVLTADQPYNCLPSLHVSTVALVALHAWELNRPLGLFLAAITLSIAWSTLAVGQHLALDALGGAIAAVLSYLLAPRLWRTKYEA